MQKNKISENSIGEQNMTNKDKDTKLRLFTDQSYFGQCRVLIFSSFQKHFQQGRA